MKGLAGALLAMYAFTFLLLLIWSVMCWSNYGYGVITCMCTSLIDTYNLTSAIPTAAINYNRLGIKILAGQW